MLLNQYKEKGLFFNSNFLDETSQSGTFGYRGELVLVEGEIGDSKGHSKPPAEVVRGVVLLADEKLKLVIGALDHVESLQTFLKKYQDDLAADARVLFYIVNIKQPMQIALNGINFVLIPLVHGVPWNEAIDELALEKSDFKGQSAADKILTLFKEMQSYQPNYGTGSLEDALAAAENITREAYGAV